MREETHEVTIQHTRGYTLFLEHVRNKIRMRPIQSVREERHLATLQRILYAWIHVLLGTSAMKICMRTVQFLQVAKRILNSELSSTVNCF